MKIILIFVAALVINAIIGVLHILGYLIYRITNNERLMRRIEERENDGGSALSSDLHYEIFGTRDTTNNVNELKKLRNWFYFALFWPRALEVLKGFFDNY